MLGGTSGLTYTAECQTSNAADGKVLYLSGANTYIGITNLTGYNSSYSGGIMVLQNPQALGNTTAVNISCSPVARRRC